ncbi:MAG: hypothetical protein CVV25_02005 [Ignavibacteriae bacterium HGW-Ignavibacteriae-4]|jgi:hypothetical protein|nr:MAG: hypothetical protein CVV25_02005 [Ignavibacteriae bacterium HGW-Ignavibacteriae-4]
MSAFAKPYFRMTDFKYEVKYVNTEGPESIELHSVANRFDKEDSIQWVFKEYKITYLDQVYCIQDSNMVMVTSPKRGVFAAAENVPNPQINYPPTIGDSIYVEQTLSNSKTMKGYLKITDTLKHGKNTNNNDVWKIEAYNLDDDKYSAIYYYNEINGFVYLNYKLNDKEIEMDLSTIIYHEF